MSSIDNLIIYVNNWLQQFKNDEKIALKMIELHKQLDWEQEVINKLPKNVLDEKNIQSNDDFYQILLDQFKEKYPVTEDKDEKYIEGNIEIIATSSSSVFKIVNLSQVSNQDSINEIIISKEKIDDVKNKIKKITEWLNLIDIKLKNEFIASVNKYELNNENQTENYIIGISMRNLIEHLKGFLWTKVYNFKSQKCSIKAILNNLKEEKLSLDITQIDKIDMDFKILHNNLSQIAKNQDNFLNIKIVFNEYINIIHTLKYFIDIKKITI